jgi:hypothetical protein
MADKYEIIRFDVRRDNDGFYTAVSPDLDGVFMAHPDLDQILDDMPNLVKLWFRSNRNMAVEVFQGPLPVRDHEFSFQAISIPAEIAAQALQR